MDDQMMIARRERLGIATLMLKKGGNVATLAAALGLRRLPDSPVAVKRDGLTAIGTGPGTWLLLHEDAAPDWSAGLRAVAAGHAAVSEQDGSYVVMRLAGPQTRALLQKGLSIDLHPDSFHTGDVAVSAVAHMGIIVWQVGDDPAYDVAIFRSYLTSFQHWLDTTAALL